jgi:hypothetical protein
MVGLAVFAVACVAAAQEKKEAPKYDMHTFQMVLLKDNGSPLSGEALAAHSRFLDGIRADNKAALVGPVTGEGALRAVVVLDVASPGEAQTIVAADAAVKSGNLKAEVHPWWGGKERDCEAGAFSAKNHLLPWLP